MGLAFITLLRAFANGGSSLTGLEAISNGVGSFRRPASVHARQTLIVMSSVLGFLVLGTTLLARWTHAVPYAAGSPTVVSQEVGDASETVDADFEGADLTIAFNPTYLIDGVEAVSGDEVLLETVDATKPATVRAAEETNFRYLLMPVRVS